jgi:hypothetical protein
VSEASELFDGLVSGIHPIDRDQALYDAVIFLLRAQIEREKSLTVLQSRAPFTPYVFPPTT